MVLPPDHGPEGPSMGYLEAETRKWTLELQKNHNSSNFNCNFFSLLREIIYGLNLEVGSMESQPALAHASS